MLTSQLPISRKCTSENFMVNSWSHPPVTPLKPMNGNVLLFFCEQDEGENGEKSASQLEISEVQLRDNTRLSSREMYRLSQRIVVDWDRLAGLMDITRAEREDICYSLLYNDSRSRAEKILSIFNQTDDFSREKLAACLEEIQQLELVEPVTTGEWRS